MSCYIGVVCLFNKSANRASLFIVAACNASGSDSCCSKAMVFITAVLPFDVFASGAYTVIKPSVARSICIIGVSYPFAEAMRMSICAVTTRRNMVRGYTVE